MKIKVDFSGGLELMFENKRNIDLEMSETIKDEEGNDKEK